jgi:hypothetical protein
LVAAWNHAAHPSFARIRYPRQPTTAAWLKAETAQGHLQTLPQPQLAKVLSQPLPKKLSRKPVSPWKPLTVSLTRDEIRAMIIDQIG